MRLVSVPGQHGSSGGRPPEPPSGSGRVRLGDQHRRLRIVAILGAVLLALISLRLLQLQGLDSRRYSLQAEKQRLRSVDLAATRGAILDRNGVALASQIDARDIYADPREIKDPLATATALSAVLHRPLDEIFAKLVSRGSFMYLARGVDPSVGNAITKLDRAGVGVLPASRRVYAAGGLAGSVLGFTNIDGKGQAGIEEQFNSLLTGRSGSLTVEEDPNGHQIPTGIHKEKSPVQGTDVQLTVDRDIQWATQTALAAQVKAQRADFGMALVMNPRTGEIYAMANAPSYDPNNPGKTSTPLSNPVISTPYEPGSVAKVATIGAALQKHVVTPLSPFHVPDFLRVDGYTIRDAEGAGGNYTLAGVLAKSSNLGTVGVAQLIGNSAVESSMRSFGLGAPTGISLPGESSGVLTKSSTWSAVTADNIPFGQGMSATALQIADMYGAIANGGVWVAPRIVKGTIVPGHTEKSTTLGPTHRVLSADTAKTLSEMLEMVTSKGGTAPGAAIPGYRVAGKTGTAQRAANGGYQGYVGSFVGFAPADNPQLLVYVVLNNPKVGHFGADVAAPVFKQVMQFALASLRIPPTGTTAPSFPLYAP
jgi:cell division protein FtsI (penicillin-binding protein 3)